jgi:hypothetical protein
MKISDDSPPVLTALNRPNSYIGRKDCLNLLFTMLKLDVTVNP